MKLSVFRDIHLRYSRIQFKLETPSVNRQRKEDKDHFPFFLVCSEWQNSTMRSTSMVHLINIINKIHSVLICYLMCILKLIPFVLNKTSIWTINAINKSRLFLFRRYPCKISVDTVTVWEKHEISNNKHYFLMQHHHVRACRAWWVSHFHSLVVLWTFKIIKNRTWLFGNLYPEIRDLSLYAVNILD